MDKGVIVRLSWGFTTGQRKSGQHQERQIENPTPSFPSIPRTLDILGEANSFGPCSVDLCTGMIGDGVPIADLDGAHAETL